MIVYFIRHNVVIVLEKCCMFMYMSMFLHSNVRRNTAKTCLRVHGYHLFKVMKLDIAVRR